MLKEWINFEPGDIVKHYKGNMYVIIAEATHTETNEPLIVYKNLKNNSKIWARPKEMFNDYIDNNTRRFNLIKRGN